MSRTVSVSGVPEWLLRYLVAGFAVFFGLVLGGQALLGLLGAAGVSVSFPDGLTGLALFTVLWSGLTFLWVRRTRGWEGSGSMWRPIPEEQYVGRFADAGGIARHNWEKTIRQLPGGDEGNSYVLRRYVPDCTPLLEISMERSLIR